MVRIIGIAATFAAVLAVASAASDDACSSSEKTETEAVLLANNDATADACAKSDTLCSSECIELQTEMAAALPDCEYMSGVNYLQTTLRVIASCDGVSSDPTAGTSPSPTPTTSTNSSPSTSTDSTSSPTPTPTSSASAQETESPASSSSGSTGSSSKSAAPKLGSASLVFAPTLIVATATHLLL